MKILGTDTSPGTHRSSGPADGVLLQPVGALQGRDVESGGPSLRPGLVQRLLGCFSCAQMGSGQLTPEAFAAQLNLLDRKVGRQSADEVAFGEEHGGVNLGDPNVVAAFGYWDRRRFSNLVESRAAIEAELLAMLREINESRDPSALIDALVAVKRDNALGVDVSKYQGIVTRMQLSLGVAVKDRPSAPPRPFHRDLLALYNRILGSSTIPEESNTLLRDDLFNPTSN